HTTIFSTTPPPPTPPLLPYPTLFRSQPRAREYVHPRTVEHAGIHGIALDTAGRNNAFQVHRAGSKAGAGNEASEVISVARCIDRSEEHTSELQSRENLVCRLLLEKKK